MSGTSRIESARHEGFVERLRPAIQRAAEFARELEGRVTNAPKLNETSAVKQALTTADTGAQEIILQALLEYFPDVSLAAEEDTKTVAAFPEAADEQVVIDPIDGTLHSYLEASGPYAVIVGLAVRSLYRAAIVSLPREGLFYDGTFGQGAYVTVSGRARRPVRASPDGNRVLVSHGMPESVMDDLRSRDYVVVPACGGAVSVAPLIKGVCAGVRRSETSLGISIRGRVGVLIAREAGALVRAANGATFPNDMQTPSATLLIGSDPKHLEHLDEALATIPS
jgi:fructose-1,6-bisphosphatase/inositol monophosphatase family enzyme